LKNSDLLCIRADASRGVGTGHVMRCLALAQSWQDQGGSAVFVYHEMPENLTARLAAEGMQSRRLTAPLSEIEEFLRVVSELSAAWVVLDGYLFPPSYHAALRSQGFKVLCIDDMAHLKTYHVDLVLNQNLSAQASDYDGKTMSGTHLLLGPQFSLLRREFSLAAGQPRQRSTPPRRLLVSFGGSDLENLSTQVLAKLATEPCQTLEVRLLVGATNPRLEELADLVQNLPYRAELIANTQQVAAHMDWADGAVSAAGSTVWELCCMRVPSLLMATSPDQLKVFPFLGAVGLFQLIDATCLPRLEIMASLQKLGANVAEAPAWMDAKGASRVVEKLRAL
jgi:UDP-2,4-diacetamido-2,4,6-trideoxy-beta-L-altropyranose hydrolase